MSRERKVCLFVVGDGVPDIPFGKIRIISVTVIFLFKGNTSVFFFVLLFAGRRPLQATGKFHNKI